MKKMYHKKYAIVIIAVLAIIMSACSKSAEYNQDKNADWDEQEYNVKTLNEIIRCLDEKDEQALINMMSKNIRKEFNVSAQIEQAFSVYGKTEDYGEFNDHGIMSSDVRHGRYTRKVIGAEMKGVKTDSGRIFDRMHLLMHHRRALLFRTPCAFRVCQGSSPLKIHVSGLLPH